MTIQDIKRYRGYLPIKMYKQDILLFMSKYIGQEYLQYFWVTKFDNLYKIRYRFGDINQAQFYMRDKSWHGIPLSIWMKLSLLDVNELDQQCWQFFRRQRQLFNITVKNKVKSVRDTTSIINDLL